MRDPTYTLSKAIESMLAKRSNTSPPLIRSPCLAPDHFFRQKENKLKKLSIINLLRMVTQLVIGAS